MESSPFKARVLSPSRFQRIITDEADGSLTILSATSNGIEIGPGSIYSAEIKGFPGGIFIFSEKVGVRVPEKASNDAFSCSSADLQICCTELEIQSLDRKAVISANGSDGSGIERKNGQPAHNACGGTGASFPRTSQKDSVGGNGGAGGSVFMIWKPSYSQLQNVLRAFKRKYQLPKTWTAEDGVGAELIHNEHFLFVDLKRALKSAGGSVLSDQSLSPAIAPLRDLLSTFVEANDNGVDPATEIPLRTVYTVTAAINRALTRLDKLTNDIRIDLTRGFSADGGPAGKAGDLGLTAGGVGDDGREGIVRVEPLDSSPNNSRMDVTEADFMLAHPVQCKMLLEKARMYFYFGNSSNKDKAKQLLETLIDRLYFITPDFYSQAEKGTLSSALPKAYSTHFKTYAAMLDCVQQLSSVRSQAVNLYVQLTSTNVDYYGLPENWVPRTNYETIQKSLDSALSELERTEVAYLTHLNELDQKDKLDKHVTNVTGRLRSTVNETEADIGFLMTMLSEKYKTLMDTSAIEAIMAARRSAEEGLLRLQDAINSHFEVSPKSVLNGLVNIAGSPTAEAASAQGLAIAYEGFSSIPSVSGDPIPKGLLLRQLSKGSANTASSKKEVLALNSSSDGSLNINAAFSSKLLVDMQSVDALLDEFSAEIFWSFAGEAKAYFKKFSDLIVARNSTMVEYNLILKTILSKQAEIDSLNQTATQLQHKHLATETNTAEELRNATTLIESIYDNNRARVMKLLSFLQRSLRYKTLSNADFLQSTMVEAKSQANHDAGEEAALSMTSVYLGELRRRLCDDLFKIREQQGSDVSMFPSNFESGGIGMMHELSGEELHTLLQTGEVQVRIPLVDKNPEEPAARASDFCGCADMPTGLINGTREAPHSHSDHTSRRFTRSEVVTIKLTHCGAETFVNRANEKYFFTHDPISTTFSYRLFADGSFNLSDTTSGDIVNFSSSNRESNSVYAAPSPFTTWTVSLRDLDLANLDLREVTEGKFEFLGTYRSFLPQFIRGRTQS